MALLALGLVLTLAAATEDGVQVMEGSELAPLKELGASADPGDDDEVHPKAARDNSPLADIPKAAPSKIGSLLQDRKQKRLTDQAFKLQRKYDYMKADKEQADAELRNALGNVNKVGTKIEEAKAAKLAAKNEQDATHAKLEKAHMDAINAHAELAQVKEQDMKAQAFVDEAKVQVEYADSNAETAGGDNEDLEQAQTERDSMNQELKEAKAELVSRQLAYGKIEAAVEAAKTAAMQKDREVEAIQVSLSEADNKFVVAVTAIKHGEKEQEHAMEMKASAQAHEEDVHKRLRVAHGLAHAASLVSNKDPRGEQTQIKALMGDQEEAQYEAIGQAKDHDGFGDDGKPLVAADGQIAAEYTKRYNSLPLPDNGQNPILEAEAAASVASGV